jgi:DNA-binding response OmpR family regulator
MEAGMNDFIAKPFNPECLFAIILKWLQRENR